MSSNISKYCPNYYRITEFEFLNSDYISLKLVNFYKQYVCHLEEYDETDLKKATKVDKIIAKYIDDYTFRKEMKQQLLQVQIKSTVSNVLKAIIDSIIKIFDKYELSATRNIFIAHWI